MRRCGRKVFYRAAAAAASIFGLLVVGVLLYRSIVNKYDVNHARQLVRRVQGAEIGDVLVTVAEMRDYREWTDPELKNLLKEKSLEPDRRLRASLALLPVDPGQVEYLFGRLLDAPPEDLSVLCQFLHEYRAALSPRLWAALLEGGADDSRVLGPSARWLDSIPRARAGKASRPRSPAPWLRSIRLR